MSIQLEEKTFAFNGKTYVLRANMSVLDRIQEDFDGDINKLMAKSINNASALVLAEMLNDYAEEQGWDDHWTEKRVKTYVSMHMLHELDISGMFFRSITPINTKEQKPENSGN